MISYYEKSANDLIAAGSVVHIYIVVRQEKKYCGMRSFVELRVPDDKESCGFKRDVELVNANETEEKDADSETKPNDVLPMALLNLLQTLKTIESNPLLERYRGKNCYWIHIKHPMAAIYFTHEINYMQFFGLESKNGGNLRYVDTIKGIHQQLEKLDSVIKGDANFYDKKNDMGDDVLSFFKEPYAFVPDPEWLAKYKKTKNYKSKILVGTPLTNLKSNRQAKRTHAQIEIPEDSQTTQTNSKYSKKNKK